MSISENQFPNVSKILRYETYVGDILSGGFSIEETIKAQNDLIAVIKSAGFLLKKLTANDPKILADLSPEGLHHSDFLCLWNALSDTFTYSLGPMENY